MLWFWYHRAGAGGGGGGVVFRTLAHNRIHSREHALPQGPRPRSWRYSSITMGGCCSNVSARGEKRRESSPRRWESQQLPVSWPRNAARNHTRESDLHRRVSCHPVNTHVLPNASHPPATCMCNNNCTYTAGARVTQPDFVGVVSPNVPETSLQLFRRHLEHVEGQGQGGAVLSLGLRDVHPYRPQLNLGFRSCCSSEPIFLGISRGGVQRRASGSHPDKGRHASLCHA